MNHQIKRTSASDSSKSAGSSAIPMKFDLIKKGKGILLKRNCSTN